MPFINELTQHNNNFYKTLFEDFSVGIAINDVHGNFVRLNRRLCQMYGYDESELIGESFTKVIPPETESLHKERLNALIESKEEIEAEVELVTQNGEQFNALASSKCITDDDGQLFIISTVRDVSQETLLRQEVRQNEKQIKLILNTIPDLILLKDEEGKIKFANHAVGNLVGISLKELIGKSMTTYMPHLTEIIRRQDLQTLEKGSLQYFDSVIIKPVHSPNLKSPRFFDVIKIPIQFIKEGKIEILTVCRDVTELELAKKELENSNQALKNFAKTVAHDLRSPLASIRGLIQAAHLTDSLDEVYEILDLQEEKLLHLEEFIIDMLSLSQNQSAELTYSAIDLNELYEAAFATLHYINPKVEIIYMVKQEVPFCSDVFRLRAILSNLMGNAIKYYNPYRDKPFVHVEMEVKTATLMLSVKDNGIGIKEEYQAKIFDAFFRATAEQHGNGVGLHIVKEAVEKLGGTIDFKSDYGKGTSFFVTIPDANALQITTERDAT